MNCFKEFTWNTGRGYSAAGQVIEVRVVCLDDASFEVWFNDTTRSLSGRVSIQHDGYTTDDYQDIVMSAYDNNRHAYLNSYDWDACPAVDTFPDVYGDEPRPPQ